MMSALAEQTAVRHSVLTPEVVLVLCYKLFPQHSNDAASVFACRTNCFTGKPAQEPQQLARCQLAGFPPPLDPWSAAHFLVLSSSLPEVLSTKPFSLT